MCKGESLSSYGSTDFNLHKPHQGPQPRLLRGHRRVGLHSLAGVRLVTWNTLAVIKWCFDCKIT
jgi:hypothetical protein